MQPRRILETQSSKSQIAIDAETVPTAIFTPYIASHLSVVDSRVSKINFIANTMIIKLAVTTDLMISVGDLHALVNRLWRPREGFDRIESDCQTFRYQ